LEDPEQVELELFISGEKNMCPKVGLMVVMVAEEVI
jgi:hypothetical protein